MNWKRVVDEPSFENEDLGRMFNERPLTASTKDETGIKFTDILMLIGVDLGIGKLSIWKSYVRISQLIFETCRKLKAL
ncbi:Hypothetical predicted protein [Octopus vulgaris]|uniref:Uncharacterized protein n=1 Tax=Octopus vulgaris TaxID=6645 RepID=A0AA36F268_OCTVU|nr:Hypothetical predicted protein [Octopus vulgaris]